MTKSTGSAGTAKAIGGAATMESVADILERELQNVIVDWLARVEEEPDLRAIPLSFEERTGHLRQLLHDVITRLRLDAGRKAPISKAAAHHGDLRRKQGYTVAMAVQESRLLQVTIFATLHKNTNNLEFRKLLPDVVTIADEVDAQLKEQMLRFMAADAGGQGKGKQFPPLTR
jgi:RsbT co-antagonist protein rsbRD N-terminal domain